MLTIDGSYGEGGGQILRTSLSLSILTSQPFYIQSIRANRKKPGLMRQHLTAVKAASQISNAKVTGAHIGSEDLTFEPQSVVPGEYHFSVGTAGSAIAVLQSILPAFLTAPGPSHLVLEGGTHNPYAPPFDFLQKTYLPLVCRMGPQITAYLERPGFYPAGGGKFDVTIEPVEELHPIHLLERGRLQRQSAEARVAQLPLDIAQREIQVIRKKTGWSENKLNTCEVKNSRGPGNVLIVELEHNNLTEVFTGFGEIKTSAETVAKHVVNQVRRYQTSTAPVGEYLADQLVLLIAIAGEGSFRTTTISKHTLTNIHILQQFLPISVEIQDLEKYDHLIKVITN